MRLYGYAADHALLPYVFIDYASVDAPLESGKSYYPFTDPSGLPIRIEDASGDAVWTAHHTDPYGAITVRPLPYYLQCNAIEYRRRWPGHYFDPDLGLHYNRYRDYDPQLGRYIEPDPLGHAGGINLYAYCRDPIGDVDLLGLHPQNKANGVEAGQGRTTTEGDGNARVRPVTARNARRGEQLDLLGARADGWAGAVDGNWRRLPSADGSPPSRRETDFPGGYPQSTWDTLAQRHTDEGRAQGRTPMRMGPDGTEERIPHHELTWLDGRDLPIDTTPRTGPPPRPNGDLTFDHRTPCAQMWVEGATVTERGPTGAPRIGSNGQPVTRQYPAGHNTNRETRGNFYHDPNNLAPMSARENSGKGSEAADPVTGDTRRYRYDEATPGPGYSN